jgi:hypothetical protein
MLPVIPHRLMVTCISGDWVVIAYNENATEGIFLGFVFATQREAEELARLIAKPWDIPIIVAEDNRTAVERFQALGSAA